MAYNVEPPLEQIYGYGNTITVVNGFPLTVNKSSVDATDALVVDVTAGTGRAAVLSGAPVMVGPSTAVANGNLDVAVDGAPAQIVATSYGTGNAPAFRGRSARGTLASPTASQSGDLLASFSARGYGTTAFASSAAGRYGVYASETWSDTNQGTQIQLETTLNTTITRVVRTIITNDGRIVIGATASNTVPSINANGTTLEVKLGDNSAYAPLTGTTLTGNTSLIAGISPTTTINGNSVTGSGALTVEATSATLFLAATGSNIIEIVTNGANRWAVVGSGFLQGTSGMVNGWTSSSSDPTMALDTGESRLGAASFAFGNGTFSDVSGTLNFSAAVMGGAITKYNNVSTVGWGVPAIYGYNRFTAQTAAVATIASYTVGAADGSFEVGANVNVTTYASGTFTTTVSYTDETNTPQTLTLNFSTLAGVLGTAIAAAGPFEGVTMRIRAKASTSITVATTGTFTSLTYNVEAGIEQVA